MDYDQASWIECYEKKPQGIFAELYSECLFGFFFVCMFGAQ